MAGSGEDALTIFDTVRNSYIVHRVLRVTSVARLVKR